MMVVQEIMNFKMNNRSVKTVMGFSFETLSLKIRKFILK